MIIRELRIRDLGSVKDLTHLFSGGVELLPTRHAGEVSLALRLCLNHKELPLPEGLIRDGTQIEARVTVAGAQYSLRASPNESHPSLLLRAYDERGTDVTEEYLYLSSHCAEQDLSELFTKCAPKSLLRVLQYANEDRYYSPRELSGRTGGLSETKSFRAYLRSFIRGFEPETIREGKRYELALDGAGYYTVKCRGEGESLPQLSESERVLFRYLCFLRTAEFWRGFEEIRNLHGVRKPLIVTGLFERLDASISIDDLILRTESLQRQAIILIKK